MSFDLESLSEATSGAIGALVNTTVLYPLDTCKNKYQAEVRSHNRQKYRGLYCHCDPASSRMQTSEFGKSRGLWKTLSEGTWSEAFDALGISLLLMTNPSIQYTVFDQLKQRLQRGQLSKKLGTESSSDSLSAVSAFVLGAVSKCIATCLTYPAIRCKVMIQAAESEEDRKKEARLRSRKTVSGAIQMIWRREGLLGFFKGLDAQILKTVLSSALLLMGKEKITKTTWVLLLALQSYLFIAKTRLKSA